MATTTRKKAAPKVPTPGQPFAELGATGLKHNAGLIDEEFIPDLRSSAQRYKQYREMRDNSPVIGGALFAIENILRGVRLDVEPAGDAPEDAERAAFVKDAIHAMAQPWGTTLTQALSMLPFGWSLLEVVYDRRPDGRIGWRKMVIRGQDSLDRWEFDERGELVAMWQRPAPTYRLIRVPLDKALLFRTTDHKGSPEGRSLLRNCVIPWRFVKRIQVYEAIGVERGLNGIPVGWLPSECFSATAGSQPALQLAAMKALVTNVRRDEQGGILMPLAYDSSGNKKFDLTLLTTAGKEKFDTETIVGRYEARMLQSMLADFIMLGHEKVGSFALSSDKTDLFTVAIGAILDSILETINRVEIPRVYGLNGWPAPYAKLTRGNIGARDLGVLGDYVQKLGAAGLLLPSIDGRVERALLEAGGLPVPDELTAEDADSEVAA